MLGDRTKSGIQHFVVRVSKPDVNALGAVCQSKSGCRLKVTQTDVNDLRAGRSVVYRTPTSPFHGAVIKMTTTTNSKRRYPLFLLDALSFMKLKFSLSFRFSSA